MVLGIGFVSSVATRSVNITAEKTLEMLMGIYLCRFKWEDGPEKLGRWEEERGGGGPGAARLIRSKFSSMW